MTEQFLIALLTAVVAVVSVFTRQWLTTKVGPERLATMARIAKEVVVAADERAVGLGLGGEDKYTYAALAFKDLAKRLGIKVTDAEVDALVHSALAEHKEAEVLKTQVATAQSAYDQGAADLLQSLMGQPDPDLAEVLVKEPATE